MIDNVDTQGKYRILGIPDDKDLAWPKQLRVGSGTFGWIMLKDVPIWYELWRQFNGFPPDYITAAKPAGEEAMKKNKKSSE